MVTMLIAFVIGFVGLQNKDIKVGSVENAPTTSSSVDKPINNNPVKAEKPKTYSYPAESVKIVEGGDTISYSYIPSVNATSDDKPVTAYKYTFGNTSTTEDMAVYIKNINLEGIEVSYVYDTWNSSVVTGETSYTTQKVSKGDNDKNIYILVTPENNVLPNSFTLDVTWTFGKAGTINVPNPETGVMEPQLIVKGQQIEEPVAPEPTEEGYYFDAWFYDEEFTKPATFPLKSNGLSLYPRYANVPQGVTTYMTYSNGNYSFTSVAEWNEEYWDYNYDTLLTGKLVIPTYYDDGINGRALVTSIGANAFEYVSDCRVVLPPSIISIKESAFGHMYNDSSAFVDLTSCINLTYIGSSALCPYTEPYQIIIDFTKLTKLQVIGDYAFNGPNLTNVDLSNCTMLREIGSYAFSCMDGSSALTSVPTTLESLGSGVLFSDEKIVDLSAWTNLKTIYFGVFSNCSNVTNIILPPNLRNIKEYGFSGFCGGENLQSISIDSSNQYFVTVDGVLYNKNKTELIAYPKAKSDTSYEISSTVKIIKDAAFSGSDNLMSIKFSESLEFIGYEAFANCDKLSKVDLSKCLKLVKIGDRAFASMALTSIDLANCGALESIGSQCFSTAGLTSIVIPKNVKNIDYAAFTSNTMVEVYNLSKLTMKIGDNANKNGGVSQYAKVIHTSLDEPSRVVISEGVAYYKETETSYMALTLADKSVTDIVLHEYTTSILEHGFEFHYDITSIVISKNVKSIGSKAFQFCTNLKTVYNLSGLTITKGSTANGYVAYYADNVYTSLPTE